jgi:hypothetical protein
MSFIYTESLIDNAFNYETYQQLIDELLKNHKTTGPNQDAALVNYTRLNMHRMRRLDKTITLGGELKNALSELKGIYTFLVLTEAWCGDAAQIVPVLNQIAKAAGGKINLRFLLRDENLELMDHHLFNNTRSIPRLIVLNEQLEEVKSWGPRPHSLQLLIDEWRTDPLLTHDMWAEKAHAWYAADRTQSTQLEITKLIAGL